MMNITKTMQDGVLTIALSGRLDTTTAPNLQNVIENSATDSNELIMDLQQLEYTSSAGLRVILIAQKMMNKKGGMKLIHVSDDVMEVFDITGFLDILTIE